MLLALTCAADLHRATAGRFDPTILDALERSRLRPHVRIRRPRCRTRSTAREPVRSPGSRAVEIDADGSRVRLPPGTRLDLGGIGKGLAADLVARGLVDRGARHRARRDGRRPPRPRRTAARRFVGRPGARSARRRARRVPVPLAEGAIVTSTTRIRSLERGAAAATTTSSIPTTGDSARTGVAAVVAAARDAWWAEGIAKSIIVAGDVAGAAAGGRNRRSGLALPRRRKCARRRSDRDDDRSCSASSNSKLSWYAARVGADRVGRRDPEHSLGPRVSTRLIRRKGVPPGSSTCTSSSERCLGVRRCAHPCAVGRQLRVLRPA